MLRRLLAAAWLVALVAPALAADPPAVVYGVDLDVRGERERVLVFSSGEREPQVREAADGSLELILPNSVLDATAPPKLEPTRAGTVRLVTLREEIGDTAPRVHVKIVRRDAASFEIEARGATLGISFARVEPEEDEIVLSFESAELSEIVKTVADLTGERFVFDESFKGRGSVVVTTPFSRSAALTLLHSLLQVAGYSAVRTPSGAHRIVPIAELASRAELRRPGDLGDGDAPVATSVRLAAADAGDLAARLAPWAGSKASVLAHAQSNTLMLAGSESHVRTLLELVQALDTGAGEEFWVRRLRYRDAAETETQLEAILANRTGRSSRASISSNARSQLLIVVAPREELDEIRGWVAQLDRRPQTSGELHVRRLRHADPVATAELLGSLAAGGDSGARGAGAALAGRSLRAVVDQGSGALVLRADPETYRIVEQLLDEIDVPTPRVEVEVTLLEVLTSEGMQLGFDALLPVAAGNSRTGGGALLNPTGGGLFQPGTSGGPNFGLRYSRSPIEVPIIGPGGIPLIAILPRETFVLTADESFVASRVLQRPHLTILAGEEQEIFAGNNVPIPVAAADAGADPLTTRLQVERYDVGISLRVAASVGEAGRVRLELDVESSRVAGSAIPQQGAVIQQRTLSTVVLLDDAQPALVGGAELAEMQLVDVDIPWLRDVPMLGTLLGASSDRRAKLHLVIAAQARVHRDPSDDEAASIRRRLGFERALARRGPISSGDEPGWGLRIATRTRLDDAQAIATSFELAGETVQVSSWEAAAGELHDVVLLGFDSFGAIGAAAQAAREAGFSPELIPLPAPAE